jgi:serine/threonine-protein kinase
MIGETIGNYRVLAQIGQGAMGTVYQAEDTLLGRKVAIKVLNPGLVGHGGNELERFQAEARIQANLNHANVVTLLSFEPCRDSYCMIMEYVHGKTLAELVRRIGAFPSNIVVNIAKQALDGLTAAHKQQVVHRDLKSSNIMMTPEGVAKVMDFGIAKAQGGKNLTASGVQVGTILYMSPEQVKGDRVDARSDIYSFGIIMFELLTGSVPFKDESDYSIMVHHVKTPPPPPTQLLPDIPKPLEQIVLRCLQKDPQQRFQSAGEIIACLDAFEEGERAAGRGEWYARKTLAQWLAAPSGHVPRSPAAVPPRPAAPPAPPKPPSRMTLILVLALLAVVAGGAAFAYFQMHRRERSIAAMKPDETASQQAAAREAGQNAAVLPGATAGTAGEQQASATRLPEQPQSAVTGGAAQSNDAAAAGKAVGRVSDNPRAQGAVAPAAGAAAGQFNRSVRSSQGDLPDSAPGKTVDAAGGIPRNGGFLVYLDADPAGERLPLSLAQTRLVELLRDAGRPVVSAAAAANLRSAVDRDDLSELRRSGVGHVLTGTAHASVETQTAYGSTYYVARVTVAFELTRMSDGKVAATSNSEARSRGSADLQAALKEALLNATSEAARDLLRKIQS